jgi:small subunit ribosomal protein S18
VGKKRLVRRPPAPEQKRQKANPLNAARVEYVDYKDVALLRTFISERGKIRSRRVTGLTVQQQRQVANAIKNAREMALLPYATLR